jgi:hypothetical protein
LNKTPAVFLFISGSGAELTWLYAWACFLLFSFFHRLYPLPATLGTFSLAAFLTLFQRRRSRRMIQIIGMHLIGLACAGLWVVHVFFYRSASFWNLGWLTDFFNRPRDHFEWFLLIFVLGYTVMFWATGVRFALQERSYFLACTRFDRGVAAFFCLFLIKLLLHTQMGVQFQDSTTVWLIFPFFIFSLTEIGLTRNQGHGLQKAYLSGYHAVGVFTGFSVGAVILGTAVFLFFLPYLKSASMVDQVYFRACEIRSAKSGLLSGSRPSGRPERARCLDGDGPKSCIVGRWGVDYGSGDRGCRAGIVVPDALAFHEALRCR